MVVEDKNKDDQKIKGDKRKKCTCIKKCKKHDCPGAKPVPQAKQVKSNCCSNI